MVFVKRLVQLDVDSTFIQQEAIELLAAKAGVFRTRLLPLQLLRCAEN